MPSLLWKEWHEQRWKLAFGCIILGAFALIGLRARVIADQMLLQWVCALGIVLLPILSATGLMPAERGEGSFEALLALPVAPWRVLLAKTLGGMLLVAGPLIVAGAVSLAVAGGREMSSAAIAGLYARSIAASLSLFIWMLAPTSGLPNEARAGLLALGVLVCWVLVTLGLAMAKAIAPAWLACPFVFTTMVPRNIAGRASLLAAAIGVQAAIAIGLWFWAAARLADPMEAQS